MTSILINDDKADVVAGASIREGLVELYFCEDTRELVTVIEVDDGAGNMVRETVAWSDSAVIEPYIKYVALVSQGGVEAPTVIVLENTLGVVPVFSRDDVGRYKLTSAGAFTANKTTVSNGTIGFTGESVIKPLFTVDSFGDVDNIYLQTVNLAGVGIPSIDDVLSNILIEIRVYP